MFSFKGFLVYIMYVYIFIYLLLSEVYDTIE